jgi:hypothetical protein
MNKHAVKKSLAVIFLDAIKSQPQLYRMMLPIVLLVVIVKDLYLYCGGMPAQKTLFFIVSGIMTIALIFLFSCSIKATDLMLRGSYQSLRQVFSQTLERMLHVYLICVFVMIYIIGFYYLGTYAIYHWGGKGSGSATKDMFILFLFAVAPILFGVVTMLFSPALILTRGMNAFQAIKQSILMTWFHWFYAFSVYACLAIIIVLVLPISKHIQFMIEHHIIALFDFIVLALLLPIFTRIYLLVLLQLEAINT